MIWQPEMMQKAAAELFGEKSEDLVWRTALGDHIPAISYLGLDIASQVTLNFPAGTQHVELLMKALLAMCLRRYASTDSRDTALVGILSRQVLQVIRFIDSHLMERISINDICEENAISSAHLNRLFRTELGVSPWEYVQRRRISHAANLLTSTSYSIGHIYELLRFSSRSNFIRRFNVQYGCSPSQYRRTK